MVETIKNEPHGVEVTDSDKHKKLMMALIPILNEVILTKRQGATLELLSFPKTSEPDVEDRVSDLETKIETMEREIKRLRKQLDNNIKIMDFLKESLETVIEKRVNETLEDIGFSPITSAVLSEYDVKEVEKCKSTIIEEIKLTNGVTDASDIAKKYGFPTRLVAGCFDYLLSEGKIGQIEE